MDYLHIDHYSNSAGNGRPAFSNVQDCVLLNNGNGWDIAFRCFTSYDTEEKKLKYYGDCAG